MKRYLSCRRAFALVTAAIVIAMTTGCDQQADPGATLRNFVTDFTRSALAAFLL